MDSRMTVGDDRLSTVCLLILTAVGLLVCGLILWPLGAPITWSLVLAVAAQPFYRALRVRRWGPNLAAAASCAVVTLGVLLPTLFVGQQIAKQTIKGAQHLRETVSLEEIRDKLQSSPAGAWLYETLEDNIDVRKGIEEVADAVRGNVGGWVQGTVWVSTQILITVFLLFYGFRDQDAALNTLYWLLPLTNAESNRVVVEVSSMVRAVVYGTLIVSAARGALGGLMFWILGLPAPLIWGFAMAALSTIPVLGAFFIWFPAAVWLALAGEGVKALILTVWGLTAIGLVDNLLYPMLVGKETRVHTVPVFLSIAGGLLVFGITGVVLGPVALVTTVALVKVVKQRMNGEGIVQQDLQETP